MNSLDNYDVLSVIGSGAFGTCFKIRNKTSNEIFAWKAINYDDCDIKTLLSEIQLLQNLKHSNIVQYFDHKINSETKTIYIIMEYCDGGDLENLIGKCRQENLQFEEKYIWRVLYQLCRALQYCHNMIRDGIVLHRDVKPANVFLDLEGNVKLGDFGLARIIRRSRQNIKQDSDSDNDFDAVAKESLVGTPNYMSPEVIRALKYDRKSDVWAVGCLIYEMCALKPAFKGRKFDQLSRNISSGQYNCISGYYSKDLQEIISYMLEVDSKLRPNVDIILRHPFLVRNITSICNEFPILLPSKYPKGLKKLNFTDELSDSNQNDLSVGGISGISTPILRAELFGTNERRTNSNPELNSTYDNNDNNLQSRPVINYCPEDPEIITKNIFDNELRRRLQSIRVQESILRQRSENLTAREKNLNEREKRITETERQLNERQSTLDAILNKTKSIHSTILPPLKFTNSHEDSYCSIDLNDPPSAPTVAKLNFSLLPPPTAMLSQTSKKSVTFESPKKLNIPNVPPRKGHQHRLLSLRIGRDLQQQQNKKEFHTSSLKSTLSCISGCNEEVDNQINNNKRKSILSILGIHKKTNKKDRISNCTKENEDNHFRTLKKPTENHEKKVLQNLDTTNLTHRWTVENKRAAFELLAVMNASERTSIESRENQLNTITQNFRYSTRERTVLQRSRQRRSMMALSNGHNRLM